MKIQIAITLAALMAASTMGAFAQGSGADTYKSKCAMCHGADGKGETPAGKAMKAISFSSPEVTKMSEAELVAVTKNGKGKMPAYAGKLTDAQIKDVAAYVKTLEKK